MLRSIAALTALAFAAPVLADGVSYNYIEGGYQRVEFDDAFGDVDGDGFGLGGSFAVNDSWHIFANYSTADFDFDVELDQLAIGGGFHTPISDAVDFVANFSYVRLDASANGFSADDDGFGLTAGLRGMAADRLELAGFIDYVDLDQSGDDTSIRGEAWYSFTENFALGFTLGSGDDVTSYGIGGRVYFD